MARQELQWSASLEQQENAAGGFFQHPATYRVEQETETIQVGRAGLAHIMHDGSSRNRQAALRDWRAEPRGLAPTSVAVYGGVELYFPF